MPIKKINPEQYYGLMEIVEKGFFPWCKNIKTVRNWVKRDQEEKNILKAIMQSTGRQSRYKIKGSNIIQFVKAVEDGKY